MSEESIRPLAERAERVHADYRRHFAGRARDTRDLALLDRLLADLAQVRTDAEAAGGAEDTLLPVLREREALYRKERDAIAQVQAGGPDEGLAGRLDTWSRLGWQRYVRNFAGQPRPTRDLGLLKELVTDQRRWRTRLLDVATRHEEGWHAGLRQAMDANVSLFEGELQEIPASRTGIQPEQRAPLLATLANGQFTAWRRHFANRPRNSRRPALLRRMLDSLGEIHTGMIEVRDAGVKSGQHLSNIGKVKERLDLWQAELAKIETARGQAGPEGITGGLGDEANSWFQRYRDDFAGRDRATADLDAIGEICEGLQEVARAMEELDRIWGRPGNAKNLEIVLENLKSYEREWELIKAAKAANPA